MALLRNALLITIGILIGVCISRFRPVHWCLSPSGQLVPAPRADSEQDDDQAGLIESEHQLRGFGNANENRDSLQRPKYVSQETNFRRPLYVGVVTASSFLGTRVTAVNNTWGKNAPKIEYFTAEGQKRYRSLPIVSLPGVDDIYPPQKKVYRMLAYMHDNYINHFNWFLRADDDVYIRIPELLKFLSKLDPGELHYIGSPGFGRENDLKRIKLHQHERFCMGGPGVIFSRALLMKLKPHLEDCLKEVVVSWNEDVEVGRCVSRKLDIQCSWSYEVYDMSSWCACFYFYFFSR